MDQQSERRKSLRKPIGQEGALVLTGHETAHSCEVKDISSDGIGFVASQALPDVRFTILVPNHTDTALLVTGQVIRVEQLSDTEFRHGAVRVSNIPPMS